MRYPNTNIFIGTKKLQPRKKAIHKRRRSARMSSNPKAFRTLRVSNRRDLNPPGVGHQALKSAMDQVTIAKLV